MTVARYKAKHVEIDEKDPFKDDLLSRKIVAENLTEFVTSMTEPFVMSIDAPWGMGKTTFLRMWMQYMKNKGVNCLCFNAWENDFSESPLVSLIAELGIGIEELELPEGTRSTAKKLFAKAKKIGATLVQAAVPTAAKIATAGILDLGAVTEADIGKMIEEAAKKQIEKYHADKKTIKDFRERLSELVASLALNAGRTSKPLVFIIDELDRCRPTYAIELLEKIKHLFSVEGLVFVLAVDRSQLSESVRVLYGSGFDAVGYLGRFIDLEYRLPDPQGNQFVKAQFERFGFFSLLAERGEQSQHDARDFLEALPYLFSVFEFSLRMQEQCFTRIVVALRSTAPNYYLFAHLLAFLVCLRVAHRELYFQYCNGETSEVEVMTFLRSLRGGESFMKSRLGLMIEAYLIRGLEDERQREAIEKLQEIAQPHNSNVKDKERAAELLEHLKWVGRNSSGLGKYLFAKLEFSHGFVNGTSAR